MLNPAKRTQVLDFGRLVVPSKEAYNRGKSGLTGNSERPLPLERGENDRSAINSEGVQTIIGPATDPQPTSVNDPLEGRDKGAAGSSVGWITSIGRARIESELQQVLGSRTFSKSPRLRRFLEYVVKRSLEGEISTLKEYIVGLDVFDRDQSFSPGTDPIVRVEASRLRSRLTSYYQAEGAKSALRIEVPKGKYLAFVRTSAMATDLQRSVGKLSHKTIAVLPFSHVGHHDGENAAQTAVIPDQLIHLLTQHRGARVVPRASSLLPRPEMDARQLGRQLGAELIVQGIVMRSIPNSEILTQLVNTIEGYNLWSGRYRMEVNTLPDLAEAIAADLIAALVQHSGEA